MSALLNRITQSAVIRVIGVETGDMPSEQVQVYLSRLKEKMEQKTAMQTNQGMAEYNNPGPIINTIDVPTHEGKGNVTATSIGGDFDPKALTDIEYFRDKLFGSLKVPKQYFGFTGDSTGFNGGTSLTILSSRYGKTIKKIQAVLCQMITDIVNLFLIDRGLDNYVNKFTIRMQTPTTQEELDRRQNIENRTTFQKLTDLVIGMNTNSAPTEQSVTYNMTPSDTVMYSLPSKEERDLKLQQLKQLLFQLK